VGNLAENGPLATEGGLTSVHSKVLLLFLSDTNKSCYR